jgi:D-galactarolactone cycloisomerase
MSDTHIDTVETISLEMELDEPFGSGTGWHETRSAVLVRIETNDGTVGWGECWGPIAGNRELIEDLFGPLLEGMNPIRVERLYEELYDKGRRAFKAVPPLTAISGIDIALWDLKAKLLDVPISALLGGRIQDNVRTYATGHYFKWGASLEEQYERISEEAKENAKEIGALKAKIGLHTAGYGADEDIKLVRHIRETVGDDVILMVDANCSYDVPTARKVGQALKDLGVYWFEEPVPPENVDGYAHLRNVLNIKLAGGESHAPYEFDRLFDVGGLDVAQPDIAIAGGITGTCHIASLAAEHGVQLIPHVWGTAIMRAASLQLISTLGGDPWLEFDRSPNPIRDISNEPLRLTDNGNVVIPDGPGIGIEVDMDAIEQLRVD